MLSSSVLVLAWLSVTQEVSQFKENPKTGHIYQRVLRAVDWNQASQAASQMVHVTEDGRTIRGRLATITSPEELEFILDAFGANSDPSQLQQIWLGAKRQGALWDTWANREVFSYSYWGPGEPNNVGGQENALHFWNPQIPTWNRVMWNDSPERSVQRGFLVEYFEVERISQGVGPWASDVYLLNRSNRTIADFGCYLVSLVMTMKSLGVNVGADGKPVNPKNLNQWLVNQGSRYITGNNDFLYPGIEAYAGGRIRRTGHARFRDGTEPITKPVTSIPEVMKFLIKGHPVHLRVAGISDPTTEGHSVVATQSWFKPTPTFIATAALRDPGSGNRILLSHDAYKNQIYGWDTWERAEGFTRSLYAWVTSDNVDGIRQTDECPVQLLMTASDGRRTGRLVTGEVVTEIDDSGYIEEGGLRGDITGELIAQEWPILTVDSPRNEGFGLVVYSTGDASFTMGVAFRDETGRFVQERIEGAIEQGEQRFYRIQLRQSATSPIIVYRPHLRVRLRLWDAYLDDAEEPWIDANLGASSLPEEDVIIREPGFSRPIRLRNLSYVDADSTQIIIRGDAVYRSVRNCHGSVAYDRVTQRLRLRVEDANGRILMDRTRSTTGIARSTASYD